MDLVSRTTMDVDVLAFAYPLSSGLQISEAEQLPQELLDSAKEVARDLGLGRHVNDLLALKPTEEEIEKAANWVLRQDAGLQFKDLLKQTLKSIGYGAIADRI